MGQVTLALLPAVAIAVDDNQYYLFEELLRWN